MVNRFGRKPLTVVGAFISGFFAVVFSVVPNIWISVAFCGACAPILGVDNAALTGLTLERVPGFRGSMTSMQNLFRSIGLIIALIVSGILLNLYVNDFRLLMIIYGAVGITSALIALLAKDPRKAEPIK